MSQNQKIPQLLLINPWIYDFAAFDFWMKPLGFLYLAGYLRRQGYGIHLIDCLDRYNPELLKLQGLRTPRMRSYGTGKFFRRSVPKPDVLQEMPARYRCYGIPEDIFIRMLQAVPCLSAILVTSMMTYWYPGVFRVIELVKEHFPKVPVLLGGVYARLCYDHAAANSGADYVVQERDPVRITRLIGEITRQNIPRPPFKGGICDHPPPSDSPLEGGNAVELSSEDVNDARSELTPQPPLLRREGEQEPPSFSKRRGLGDEFLKSTTWLEGGRGGGSTITEFDI